MYKLPGKLEKSAFFTDWLTNQHRTQNMIAGNLRLRLKDLIKDLNTHGPWYLPLYHHVEMH